MNSHSLSYRNNFIGKYNGFEPEKINTFEGIQCEEPYEIDHEKIGTPELIKKFLRTGFWSATYISYKRQFKLILNSKYVFHFVNGIKCCADNGSKTITGEWHSGYDNDLLRLKLAFKIPQELVSFNKTWFVTYTSEKRITLLLPGDNNKIFEFLILEKP